MSAITKLQRTGVLLGLMGVAAGASLAAGTVTVSYPGQETYTDAGSGQLDREQTLRTLTLHLQSLGQRLPDGQTLQVEVLDLDLAGDLRPRGGHELRVLRGGIDWPRATLRYTLWAGGRVLKSGQDRIADSDYLFNPRVGRDQSIALPYERRMLERWFSENFAARP